MEGQVTDVEHEVIITNNNLLFQLSGHNNDLLVLKQWKGALNRIMPSLLGLLKNNDQGLGSLASHAGVFRELVFHPSTGIILYSQALRDWQSLSASYCC